MEDVVQVGEPTQIDVEHVDLGAERVRHAHGVHADDSAADHGDAAAHHARHAAEQQALAAAVLLEQRHADLHREPPRHLAHRREHGERAVAVADRLVRDRDHARVEQALREVAIRGEVQIGEQRRAALEQRHLVGERVLHLHDQLGRPGLLARDEPRAAARVLLVGEAAALAGALLHPHLVSGSGQRGHAVGHHSDAVLDHLRFARNADPHSLTPIRVDQDVRDLRAHDPRVGPLPALELRAHRGAARP